eukprot:scaffold115305_cov35-Tisochrysis_lutea.AAC.4
MEAIRRIVSEIVFMCRSRGVQVPHSRGSTHLRFPFPSSPTTLPFLSDSSLSHSLSAVAVESYLLPRARLRLFACAFQGYPRAPIAPGERYAGRLHGASHRARERRLVSSREGAQRVRRARADQAVDRAADRAGLALIRDCQDAGRRRSPIKRLHRPWRACRSLGLSHALPISLVPSPAMVSR